MMQHKRQKYPWMILMLFFLTVSSASAGKIYKWVDEQGVTQFSTYPPLVQKRDQPVTTLKGSTGSGSSAALQPEDLNGVWFTIENHKKRSLSLKNGGFSFMYQLSRTAWESESSGTWQLDGGILELHYKHHKDKSKQGTIVKYYIKKTAADSLTLIAQQGNQRWHFRKDSKSLSPDKAVSRLARALMGNWQGVGDADSINFSGTEFVISGKRKQQISTRVYESHGRKYSGRWQVDDPYIDLEIILDEVFKTEKEQSKAGEHWRWLIVDRTADALTVRDTTTRHLMKFVKTGQ